MPRPRFESAAIADVILAADWYDAEQPGLGGQFVDQVEVAAGRLGTFPESGPAVHGSVRRVLLERFPYVIYYTADSEGVLIVAVLHASRAPEFHVDRLRG